MALPGYNAEVYLRPADRLPAALAALTAPPSGGYGPAQIPAPPGTGDPTPAKVNVKQFDVDQNPDSQDTTPTGTFGYGLDTRIKRQATISVTIDFPADLNPWESDLPDVENYQFCFVDLRSFTQNAGDPGTTGARSRRFKGWVMLKNPKWSNPAVGVAQLTFTGLSQGPYFYGRNIIG
jgi:hypothetical protein